MRLRVAAALTCLALALGGCTAFVAAELAGDQSSGPPLGGCFNLPNNQCGQCIASACEDPNASPPVSLAQICAIDQESTVVYDVTNCADDPRFANYYCSDLYIDGGTYASSIDTPGQAENNLRHCITDNCVDSCSNCGITVPTCGTDTPLPEAGACGVCLDQAMNTAGAPCQKWVLQGGCYEDPSSPIGQCAIPAGQCQSADCSGLSSPNPNLVDAGYALFACLWSQCQGSCSNP
jgi:hypothetical protein